MVEQSVHEHLTIAESDNTFSRSAATKSPKRSGAGSPITYELRSPRTRSRSGITYELIPHAIPN
jgi:hypothetical protein